MEISMIFGAATSAITLAEKIEGLVEKSKTEQEVTSFIALIRSLETEALALCGDISKELRKMKTDFLQSGIDTTKTINQLYDDLKWYNFVTKSNLRKHEQKFYAVYQTLAAFIDDAEAVLICSQKPQLLSDPYKEALAQKRKLDGFINSDLPINKIIDEMMKINEYIYFRLEGGSQADISTTE